MPEVDWTMTAEVSQNGQGLTDWPTLKQSIIAKLDVPEEYRALGLKFSKQKPDSKDRIECHAINRPDEVPSAFVNVVTGVYHDSGSDGESLSLFDFALKYGSFGRWKDVIEHYAAKAGVEHGPITVKSGGRIEEGHYDYRDSDGRTRYRVWRYRLPNGKKSFSQHPPDGRGGWKFGAGAMDGIEPLPYRLPELLDAGLNIPVWVTEGEKDADRLAGLGLTATTNHQGAQSTDATWPKFLSQFRGRQIFILPDNDASGRIHARKVAAYLLPIALVVKVVVLPDLVPKGDVSTWLDAGRTLDELERFAAAAPIWDPATADAFVQGAPETHDDLPPDNDVITVRLSDVTAVPVEWLMPNRIPIGKLTLLAGMQKQGKSFLTMDLAARVSTGGLIPCGDGARMPLGSVVLLSAEDDLDDTIKPRLILAEADTDKIHALTTVRQADGTLGPFSLSYLPHLERAILRFSDTKLVIIDPITHYIGSKVDDHKVAQLRALLGPLRDLASRRHVAVLVVTHFNKGASPSAMNRVIGSGGYTALARANWALFRDPKDPKRRLFLDAGTNLVEDPTGLAFRIVGGRVEWEDSPVMMDANQAIQIEQDDQKRNGKTTKPEIAKAWLEELFAAEGTTILSDDLFELGAANKPPISRDAMFKAKEELPHIRAEKSTVYNGRWNWVSGKRADSSNGSNGSNDYGNGRGLAPF